MSPAVGVVFSVRPSPKYLPSNQAPTLLRENRGYRHDGGLIGLDAIFCPVEDGHRASADFPNHIVIAGFLSHRTQDFSRGKHAAPQVAFDFNVIAFSQGCDFLGQLAPGDNAVPFGVVMPILMSL